MKTFLVKLELIDSNLFYSPIYRLLISYLLFVIFKFNQELKKINHDSKFYDDNVNLKNKQFFNR